MAAPNIPALTLPGADSGAGVGFAPLGGMTIDAAGHVTYDFAGHIHAKGIDLDDGQTNNPPNDNRVRWLGSDGRPTTEIASYQSGSTNAAFVQAERYSGPFNLKLPTGLTFSSDPNPASSSIQGQVDGGLPFLLQDGNLRSSFLTFGGLNYYKSLLGQTTLTWNVTGTDSGAVNVGSFTSIAGALATNTTFVGSGRLVTVDALNGGSFVQLFAHASPALAAGTQISVTYLIWGT